MMLFASLIFLQPFEILVEAEERNLEAFASLNWVRHGRSSDY